MTEFRAHVATENGSRYLQQLCKHWSHRFSVAFDKEHGVVNMNGATCTFDAEPTRLVLTLAGEQAGPMPKLCEVVTEHLKRFAFREELDVRWTRLGVDS